MVAERLKVHTTAVIVEPPEILWGQIQEIRSKHDKAFERWPPHINMLYPFLPNVDETVNILKDALQNVKPFKIKFQDFNVFEHGATNTIWLDPSTETHNDLQDFQQVLQSAFPICNDLSIKSANGFTPHLTVGQGKGKKQTQQLLEKFRSQWKDIEFIVSEIQVITRSGDLPFSIAHTIPFGG